MAGKEELYSDWNETTFMGIDVMSTSATVTTTISSVVSHSSSPIRHVSLASQIVLTLVYMIGVFGNISALVILFLRDKVS